MGPRRRGGRGTGAPAAAMLSATHQARLAPSSCPPLHAAPALPCTFAQRAPPPGLPPAAGASVAGEVLEALRAEEGVGSHENQLIVLYLLEEERGGSSPPFVGAGSGRWVLWWWREGAGAGAGCVGGHASGCRLVGLLPAGPWGAVPPLPPLLAPTCPPALPLLPPPTHPPWAQVHSRGCGLLGRRPRLGPGPGRAASGAAGGRLPARGVGVPGGGGAGAVAGGAVAAGRSSSSLKLGAHSFYTSIVSPLPSVAAARAGLLPSAPGSPRLPPLLPAIRVPPRHTSVSPHLPCAAQLVGPPSLENPRRVPFYWRVRRLQPEIARGPTAGHARRRLHSASHQAYSWLHCPCPAALLCCPALLCSALLPCSALPCPALLCSAALLCPCCPALPLPPPPLWVGWAPAAARPATGRRWPQCPGRTG